MELELELLHTGSMTEIRFVRHRLGGLYSVIRPEGSHHGLSRGEAFFLLLETYHFSGLEADRMLDSARRLVLAGA